MDIAWDPKKESLDEALKIVPLKEKKMSEDLRKKLIEGLHSQMVCIRQVYLKEMGTEEDTSDIVVWDCDYGFIVLHFSNDDYIFMGHFHQRDEAIEFGVDKAREMMKV